MAWRWPAGARRLSRAHRLRLCRHGGHGGFVGACSAQDDGYWAEDQIVSFIESRAAIEMQPRSHETTKNG